MCIRDSLDTDREIKSDVVAASEKRVIRRPSGPRRANKIMACLLYTSDAADERSSVDLGGRRIIKKKKKKHNV